MTSSHYSVSGNMEFKMKMFTGFSQLQQQEEFVDLTLAADGCIVKVHRNVVALASPYLREVLKSTPNQYPIVFLNNVSPVALSYLLEYIYQGEVKVPEGSVNEFIELSRSLHIAGLDGLELPKKFAGNRNKPPEKRASKIAAHITIDTGNSVEVDHPESSHITTFTADQHESDHPKFIVEDNHTTQNYTMQQNQDESIEILDSPLIGINSNIDINTNTVQSHDSNHRPSQKNNNKSDENNQIAENTILDTPVVDITENVAALGTNTVQPNYKFIVKTPIQANKTTKTEVFKNMPVIEIQHIESSGQQNQDNKILMEDYEVLPTQTDILAQAIHETQLPKQETTQKSSTVTPKFQILENIVLKPSTMDVTSGLEQSPMDVALGVTNDTPLEGNDALLLKIDMDTMKNMAQYSLTERGAVQLILNRNIYWCHHASRLKKRWRCIDYRRRRCPAFLDTVDGAIVARKGLHDHGFHDSKIYKKHAKNLIYPTIELAIAAREKEKMMSVYETTDKSDDIEW